MSAISPLEPGAVTSTLANGVAEIVLDRPARRNALDIPAVELLREHLSVATGSAEVQAIVLLGQGPVLCSGLDLKAMAESASERGWTARFVEVWLDVHVLLADCPVPVVIGLEGAAINAGAALALAADFLVVGPEASLRLGEVHQGLAAPIGITWLTRRHGPGLARRISLLGERLTAEEMLRTGLADRQAPRGGASDLARDLAAQLAALPAEGVRRTLGAVRAAAGSPDARAHFTEVVAAARLGEAVVPRLAPTPEPGQEDHR